MPAHRLLAMLAATATLPFASFSASAVAAPAPSMPIASFNELHQPLPMPYHIAADADHDVSAALDRAKAHHKLLLVDLGGNWCLDCRLLAATMNVPVLHAWIEHHYELVSVDVGRFDKNLQILARFGAPGRPDGVPALLVVDPRSGRLLNKGHISALADARSMSPQGLADWVAQWVR